MKNSEDIKMNIGGKFINNQYNNVQELMADINKLCKQVVKEQLALYNVSGQSEQLRKRPNTSSTLECFTKEQKQQKDNY